MPDAPVKWLVVQGDARDPVRSLKRPINSVVTSPPYAEQRGDNYPGIPEKDYPQFTVDWMRSVGASLALDGSVLIVIRTHIRKGAVSDYVLRTRLALREDGWIEPEELIWWKPDGPPYGSPYRPRRGFENVLWFARSGQVFCDPKANGAVSENMKGFTRARYEGNVKRSTRIRDHDGEARVSRCQDVIKCRVGSNLNSDKIDHPAQYPVPLAEWMVKLITPKRGVVYDPFCGSGSTGVAALRNEFHFLGRDIDESSVAATERRLCLDSGAV